MRGQFLERATVIPTPTGVLEAVSHRGSRGPPLLVIPPPPGSGGMDHPVGAELAWACSRAGHPTLRFNFRGVGASPGETGGPPTQREDVEAALRALEENVGAGSAAIASLGDSASTGLALALSLRGLAGLALISPGRLEAKALEGLRPPLLVVVGAEEPSPRAALSEAVAEVGGTLVVVPGADGRFQRNLPEVGQAVVRWLQSLSPSP
jgi:uncharacterized protein